MEIADRAPGEAPKLKVDKVACRVRNRDELTGARGASQPWKGVSHACLLAGVGGCVHQFSFSSCVRCQRGFASLAEPRLQLGGGSAAERVERGECFVRFHALGEIAVRACEADDPL